MTQATQPQSLKRQGPNNRKTPGSRSNLYELGKRVRTSSGSPLWPGAAQLSRPKAPAWLPLAPFGISAGIFVGLVLAFFTTWWIAVFAALAVALASTAALWLQIDAICLSALGPSILEKGTSVRVSNMVEGLCASFGLQTPVLWMADSEAVNIASFGRRAQSSNIVVTRGLDDAMTTLELEAILGHELAHLRAGHVQSVTAMAVAAGLHVPQVLAQRLAFRQDSMELQADAWALSVTRYPPALAAAVGKLQPPDSFPGRTAIVHSSNSASSEHPKPARIDNSEASEEHHRPPQAKSPAIAARRRTASWLWETSHLHALESLDERLSSLAEL